MFLEGLDELDQKIVELLIENARMSYSEIGQRVGISRVAVKARIQALEQRGIIEEYTTIINPQKVNGAVSCYFEIELQPETFPRAVELLKENDSPSARLCHEELNQHHILMGEGFVAIIEFNKLHLGVQMEDLYHFMRKVMEKHDWDLKLGMEMLEAYGRVTPLDAFDRQYLKYLFLYPEKYWKQINFYFNASKAWIPARNLEKLKSLGRQSLARERFIEAIK